MATDEYRNLARLYDLETRDPGIQALYRQFEKSLLEAIERHGVKVHTLVDLACGTGNTTVGWARRKGWTVVGVDRSASMLRVARAKSGRVRWYRQDLTRLRLKERADAVTCHFDALNHLLDPADLQRAFDGAAGILNEGGLFQFDLNTDSALRWLAAHEKLFRVGPHCFMAFNEYDRRTGIVVFHQLWFVRKGRLFERVHVRVRERAFSTAAVRRMLARAGLRLLSVRPQSELDGKPARLLFLARKGA